MTLSWHKVNRVILLILFCGIGQYSFAQQPNFLPSTANDLLGDLTASKIFESSFGYLWIGTDQGLYRFDGLEYKAYDLPKDSSFASIEVSTLYETQKAEIWVAFANGQIFSPTFSGDLQPVTLTGLTDLYSPIRSIVEYKDQIWLATYGQGLYVLTPDNTYNFTVADGLSGNDLYQMSLDSTGLAYLATDRGVNTLRLTEKEAIIKKITLAEGLSANVIRTMENDGQDGFFIGTYDNGVYYWDPKSNQEQVLIKDWDFGVINSLSVFPEREIWIGTERKGLIQYDLRTKTYQVFSEIDGRSIGRILDLHKDQEGNLWILSNALNILKTNRRFDFIPATSPEVKEIQALLTDANDQLWLGTQTGVFQLKSEDGQFRYERKFPEIQANILSLYQDPMGNLWIGTFGEGIYIYNPSNEKIRHLTTEDGLVDGSVLSIDGNQEHIWVGTLAGVTEFELEADIMASEMIPYQRFEQEPQLNATFIYKVFVDSKNRVWLGTDSEGINLIEEDQVSYFKGTDSIAFNTVYSITEDLNGNIWFTSANNGLIKFDGETFLPFGMEDGLRNLNINSLTTDPRGNILLVHAGGIDLFDPNSGAVIYYDENIGLGKLEPNLNVFSQAPNGDIWLSGQEQTLKYIAPSEAFRVSPQTTLDEINVNGSAIDFAQKNRFSYYKNTFLFNFKGIWLTAPDALQYRYKLEGLDDDWVYTRDQEVNYVNLNPGNYTFTIGTTANNYFAPETSQSYSFTIRPPFWQQAWFILSTIALLVWITYLSLRTRERRLMKESNLKREKIESQFEALKSQINPHFLFNSFNTLVAIIEESPDMAVSYVERLSDFYRSILQYRDKTVIPLEEELSMVQNYYYLLQERFGDNLKLIIQTKETEAYVPPLCIQMLVENAIKHNIVSTRKPLQITINQDDRGKLVVSNTMQPKRKKPQSTSFGLSSIIARYALLSDKRVQVKKNNQEFSVSLPLIKSRYTSKLIDTDMIS